MRTVRMARLLLACLLVPVLLLAACVAPAPAGEAPAAATEAPAAEAPAGDGPVTLTMWYHGAGNDVERTILDQIITDFNASQTQWVIERQDFPQASYNESVVAGALAGTLPDIIDVDGPVMPNWAWAGYMSPLELPDGALDNFLPGAIGSWQGQVYSVGLWDAAIAIFAGAGSQWHSHPHAGRAVDV